MMFRRGLAQGESERLFVQDGIPEAKPEEELSPRKHQKREIASPNKQARRIRVGYDRSLTAPKTIQELVLEGGFSIWKSRTYV